MSDIDAMIFDLHGIAESRNVKVAYKRLPDEDSFIISHNEKTYICLDDRLHETKELVQLAHETGHVFCGISDEYTPEWLDDIYEKKAWIWAATYLVPYAKYKEVMRDPFVDNDIEAAAKLNVSIKILHKARKYYYSVGLPINKAALEYVYGKRAITESADANTNTQERTAARGEVRPLSFNLLNRTDKFHSQKRYDINRLKYKDYIKIMKQPNIMCDMEMAEELNVSLVFLWRARRYFRKKGLPVRQGEIITDWRDWN